MYNVLLNQTWEFFCVCVAINKNYRKSKKVGKIFHNVEYKNYEIPEKWEMRLFPTFLVIV